jgi:hypothetical protein
MSRRGHPPVLNDVKKAEILAILSLGCPRRTAASYVGCDLKSIYNTALQDPLFATELAKRESSPEIHHLHNLHNAGRNTCFWRASAWFLERRYPDQYGSRNPETLTREEMERLISSFSEIVCEEVPVAKFRKQILARMNSMFSESEENLKRRYNQGKYSCSKKRDFSKQTNPDSTPNDEKAQNSRVEPEGTIPPHAKSPINTAFQPRLSFAEVQSP